MLLDKQVYVKEIKCDPRMNIKKGNCDKKYEKHQYVTKEIFLLKKNLKKDKMWQTWIVRKDKIWRQIKCDERIILTRDETCLWIKCESNQTWLNIE